MEMLYEIKEGLTVEQSKAYRLFLTQLKRLKLLNFFKQTKSKLHWMAIKFLPVLPPNLRPIVKLEDGTNIVTDLNFLYSKILLHNERIIFTTGMLAPEEWTGLDKYILQKSINNLFITESDKIDDVKNKIIIK